MPPVLIERSLALGVVTFLGLPLVVCVGLSTGMVRASAGGGEGVSLLRFLSLGPNKTVTLAPART